MTATVGPSFRAGSSFSRVMGAGVGMAMLAALVSCSEPMDERIAIGDPHAGEVVVTRQACGYCHTIPGIPNSNGQVGPTLGNFAARRLIAGLLPNTPPELVRWLRTPQSVLKDNAMPNMGLTEQQARDVAAYLYTLK